jgi:hypothetical protein
VSAQNQLHRRERTLLGSGTGKDPPRSWAVLAWPGVRGERVGSIDQNLICRPNRMLRPRWTVAGRSQFVSGKL